MKFVESGHTLNIPTQHNPFRLADCVAYSKISRLSVKEMDVCWVETTSNQQTLWLVELKQLHDPNNPKFQEIDLSSRIEFEKLTGALHKKAWHSISMLAQNRCGTKACSGSTLDFESAKIRLVFIIKTRPDQEQFLKIAHYDISNLLSEVTTIFRLDSIAVLSPDQAKEQFPGIIS